MSTDILTSNTSKLFIQRFEASLYTVKKLISIVSDKIEVIINLVPPNDPSRLKNFSSNTPMMPLLKKLGMYFIWLVITSASTMKDFWKVLNEYHATEVKQRETLLDVLKNIVLKRLKEVEKEMIEEHKMVKYLIIFTDHHRLHLSLQN